jgi:hypothetical protein
MYFLYILCAIPALALLYTAFAVASDIRKGPGAPASELRFSARNSITRESCGAQSRRPVEPISLEELADLALRSVELILIDLRARRKYRPTAVPVEHTLVVAPQQLQDLLCWLPPQTSVVLYGSSELLESLLSAVSQLPGVAPVYVVKESERFIGSSQGPRGISSASNGDVR